MYQRIDHIVVRVNDLDTAIDDYEGKLGLKVTDGPVERPDMGLKRVYLALGDSDTFIELVQPMGEKSAVGAAIDRFGEGIHAVALVVDDRETMVAKAKAGGAKMIETPAQAFAHPRDGHGVMWQFMERNESIAPGVSDYRWIDHLVVRVENLDEAATDYAQKFDLESATGSDEQPSLGLRRVVIKLGDSGRFIELAEPLGENSAIRSSLEKRGEGIHLVALAVSDIAAMKEKIAASGARVIEAGSQIFIHPSVGHGVMYQLIERA